MKIINSLPQKEKIQQQIGILSNLKTSMKDNLVNAINGLHDSLINKLGTTDISAIGSGTVTSAISELNTGLDNITSHLHWKTYSRLAQLGLDVSCSTDDIIIALQAKGYYSMVEVPMWKADYPNIRFGGTGHKHLYTVKYAIEGYTSITDTDISNGVEYTCGHYGENYSPWCSNVLNQNISKEQWLIGHNVLGYGFVVCYPCASYGKTMTIDSADVFFDSNWKNLELNSIQNHNSFFLIIFKTLTMSEISDYGRTYLVRITGSIH